MTGIPEATPPHAPERGWSWRILGRFHVTGVFWYRVMCGIVRTVPSSLLWIPAAIFATIFFLCLHDLRAVIASNLEVVLGPCRWWERQRRVFRTMWTFGWCVSERYERLTTRRPFRVETEAIEHWNEVTTGERGLVLVTAHLGNFEIGSMLPAQREARRVHLVREREADARAQEFIEEILGRFNQDRYRMHFQGDDPLQGMQLVDALRRGEIVAVQGDRPRSGGRSIDATLFGRPFPLPPGPAAIARTADVPLLPVFVFREGRRRYRVVFRPAIRPSPTADHLADLDATMRRVAVEIEWAIRRAPHQWFCFRRLWT